MLTTTNTRPKTPSMSIDEPTFITDVLNAEADAVARIAARAQSKDADAWKAAVDLLAGCTGHVVVSGMGKSGLVGAKISATFSSLGQPSSSLHPSEAVHGDLGRLRRGDVVILLSFSGGTEEVVSLAGILQADGLPRLGISSNGDSRLAELCDVHLSLGNITEACPLNLAPTASTTAMLAIGDALALALARRRDFTRDDFQKSHPGGLLGVGLRRITEALRFRVGHNLPVVAEDLPVREAFIEADNIVDKQRRAGAIMLVDNDGRLSGIFTDGDLRRLVLDKPESMLLPISEVMTAGPKHLTVNDLVRDAERLMREHRVDEIPVVDNEGKPIGLVDVQDLISMKIVKE